MLEYLWSPAETARQPDSYLAFRGLIHQTHETTVELRLAGASWFAVWLDGEFLTEGPARYHPAYPEYQREQRHFAAGPHLIAVLAHHAGVETRLLPELPPFFSCDLRIDDRSIPIDWRCHVRQGQVSGLRRLNPCLGWAEWADTSNWPDEAWRTLAYAAGPDWVPPVAVQPLPADHAPWREARGGDTHYVTGNLVPIAQGLLTDEYGYRQDDPPVRTFLRDLAPQENLAQGVWRRYDLGRVRLHHPRIVLDLPAGAEVEFAYAESLTRGRVAPWITLSLGPSCAVDHYIARGGVQEFMPLQPRGGRFLEVHVLAPPDQVGFLEEAYLEREHFGEPEGAFACEDPLLSRIWQTGVDTLRACAEDSIIDTPTRERGAWVGDALSVGMEIAAVAYADLSIFRRQLVMAARSAREDGMVAGLYPGTSCFLPTFAAQWTLACLRYVELTGDHTLLDELYDAAQCNIAAFERVRTADGIPNSLGWGFVDWGYAEDPEYDFSLNVLYLAALEAMPRWAEQIGDVAGSAAMQEAAAGLREMLQRRLSPLWCNGNITYDSIGYHRLALSLRVGLLDAAQKPGAITYLKSHILQCFPNDPQAPRLANPDVKGTQYITPYFAHFVMPVLLEHGETDFVLELFRHCWGWALEQGLTTWPEVFDLRWSHAHHWAGCPTWQLSRYLLGLWPRFDVAPGYFHLRLHPGTLPAAHGILPIAGTEDQVHIDWHRTAPQKIAYRVCADRPITIAVLTPDGREIQRVEVNGEATIRLAQ